MKSYPKVELIPHFHDGNVLAVPTHQVEEFTTSLQRGVTAQGGMLGLRYPQKLVVKDTYPGR